MHLFTFLCSRLSPGGSSPRRELSTALRVSGQVKDVSIKHVFWRLSASPARLLFWETPAVGPSALCCWHNWCTDQCHVITPWHWHQNKSSAVMAMMLWGEGEEFLYDGSRSLQHFLHLQLAVRPSSRPVLTFHLSLGSCVFLQDYWSPAHSNWNLH